MRNSESRIYSWSVRASFARLAAAFILAGGFWILDCSAAVPGAAVVRVQPTPVADLVLLGNGFDAGLREDMVCHVSRGSTDIAEVLVVAVRPDCSAALITTVAPGQSIRAGDIATIKIRKI